MKLTNSNNSKQQDNSNKNNQLTTLVLQLLLDYTDSSTAEAVAPSGISEAVEELLADHISSKLAAKIADACCELAELLVVDAGIYR